MTRWYYEDPDSFMVAYGKRNLAESASMKERTGAHQAAPHADSRAVRMRAVLQSGRLIVYNSKKTGHTATVMYAWEANICGVLGRFQVDLALQPQAWAFGFQNGGPDGLILGSFLIFGQRRLCQ